MLSSDESGIQKERYSRPFLKKLGDLFWNVPGKRHKLFHPALIMYFLILAWYSYLLLVPYNARLSPSDFLVYTRLAATDSPVQFGRVKIIREKGTNRRNSSKSRWTSPHGGMWG